VRINRYLKESAIIPALKTHPLYPGDEDVPEEEIARIQEGVIDEFVAVFDDLRSVSNAKKLREDLLARERRNSTALGRRVAFPHVRSQQARGFAIAIARSPSGLPFGALDGQLVNVFVCMITPPHEDKFFLKVERSLAQAFAQGDFIARILEAESPGQIIRLFCQEI